MQDVPNKPTEQEVKRDEKGRFIPGQSGNPGGRPVDTLARTAKEILREMTKEGKTQQEIFVRKTLEDAFNGDNVARKIIWNYVDGLPTQKTEVTGKDGEGILIKVVDYD